MTSMFENVEKYLDKYPYNPKLKQWMPEMENCEKCPRLVNCRQAIYPGYGNLNSIIMFIGQNPGLVKRKVTGITFWGNRTGEYFLDTLKLYHFKFDDVYTTNVCKCGANDGKKNIPVSEEEIENCLPYLKMELELIKPKIIVTIGTMARDNLPNIKVVQNAIHYHTYHAGYVLRRPEKRDQYKKEWEKVAYVYGKMINELKYTQKKIGDFK